MHNADRTFAALVMLATLALLGCPGDRGPSGAAGGATDSATVATDPAVLDDIEAASLANACLMGDPSQGTEWQLDLGDPTLRALDLLDVGALSARDSARLVTRVTGAADAIRTDTAVANFRGLPVVVRDAWLLVPTVGDTTLVAIVTRQLPMESSPLEENLAIVARPDATNPRRPLRVVWYARSAGPEERVEARDPVAAFARVDGAVRVLLVREVGRVRRVESVGPDSAAAWSLRWEGTLHPCDADSGDSARRTAPGTSGGGT